MMEFTVYRKIEESEEYVDKGAKKKKAIGSTPKPYEQEGYQRVGNVMVVTGDGINDSSPLNKAVIGVAVGYWG